MRTLLAAMAAALFAACSSMPDAADPDSDAPERQVDVDGRFEDAPSYAEALKRWQGPEDVNAWIGARFRYDMSRAMQLSETQRRNNGRMPIVTAEAFFAVPSGVCVDLSRFAVETLRTMDPGIRPKYVMIEFDPVSITGNTLRRHWLVSFQRGAGHYFFADSKRPGHIAGPYASTRDFIAEYAKYRGRQIVSFRALDTYERRVRTLATRQPR
ncbi:MAG: hypothetical protein IH627_05020 [Rubrivivax sp.]|nr:hypothetical protein [Rubrivivax sp.]